MGKIIWIASFPKSGNTWMRVFLANYILNRQTPFPINDLRSFTLSDTRPRFFQEAAGRPFSEISKDDFIGLRPRSQELISAFRPHDHFVKTHSQNSFRQGVKLINKTSTKGAIYIVRNPLDLVSSYASHFGMTIDQTIHAICCPENSTIDVNDRIITFLGRWDEHIISWINDDDMPCILVRYEDLLTSPYKTFHRVLSSLGVAINDDQLARAIRFSSFGELSQQERQSGFQERSPHGDKFFRKGESGQWQNILTSEQVGEIQRSLGSTMKRLNYL